MSLLEIRDLVIDYGTRGGRPHTAVDGVSLTVEPGELVAIVGETGSGKTTTALSVLGLLASNARIRSGQILLGGTEIQGWSRRRLETVRGARVGLVPQDPGSSLDPLKTIGWQVGEALRIHGETDRARRRGAGWRRCSRASACRRSGCRAPTRTSSPGACDSAC